ncbi:dynein regulatory complex subunit 7 [Sitophilus oryzae]|uniref:Dynein regulatory complex subunit 7 n=1 Tax=Sitophilus oryzae TaxID=7048 RepID=A0A6J2YKX6_SITOR|nr:dynein regulatory complex subunit 7 [Sitophilus oryzae]
MSQEKFDGYGNVLNGTKSDLNEEKTESKQSSHSVDVTDENISKSDKDFHVESTEGVEHFDTFIENEGEEGEEVAEAEEEEKPFSYIELLDAPRELQEPLDITMEYLKQISDELGLIKMCWPDLSEVDFEDRNNFPDSYLKNNDKEKLLLLYVENFRRQFCFNYPDRKPLFLACDNECGMQKMVCTTIRPTTLPYSEIESWEECSRFVADHVKFELLDIPTLIPKHLYSPHTVFLRQSGHSFEIATALCSLLIGLGYEAYVVSGYATKDVTMRVMCRVDCPYPLTTEEEPVKEPEVVDDKYKIKPAKKLKSKFLEMMKQRELEQLQQEEEKQAALTRERVLEEEKIPLDELEGQRIHSWVLLGTKGRAVERMVFIEASTGMFHPLDSDLYCGIESLWSNENYWVNLQDCSKGLADINYNLTDTEKWEHLLVGEPIKWRQNTTTEIGDDEEFEDMFDEKHLDIPYPWSMKINIPSEVLKRRFPDGSRVTQYKRTIVEEYAPYILDDGMVQKISRFQDFDCTVIESVEEKYENRHDKLNRSFFDAKTNQITEYFNPGREDSVIKHIYYKDDDTADGERTFFFNSKARFDGLEKIEIETQVLTEHYCDREDKVYYRQVVYDQRRKTTLGDSNRRPIRSIVQKFRRNEDKSAYKDLSVREFNIKDREIYLKYHYDKNCITASTRNFIKPPISEMGEAMVFHPELTNGYQAQIGAKPPRQLQLFLLLEQQIKDEKEVIETNQRF